jgi:hypothetical protein
MMGALTASCRSRREEVLLSLGTDGGDYDPLARMRAANPKLYRITMWRARAELLAAYRKARAAWRRKARAAAATAAGSMRSCPAYERAERAALDMCDAARRVIVDQYPAGAFSTLFGRSQ